MREPPDDLDEADLLHVVRREWDPEVDRLEHLPIGFGAHHWAASVHGRRRLFVTFDRLGGRHSRHSRQSLERAYASACALSAAGLEFVLGPLTSHSGTITVSVPGGALSVGPWITGRSGDETLAAAAELRQTADLLSRLHRSPAPGGIPVWRPLLDASFPDQLDRALSAPWRTGPFGEPAREALSEHATRVRGWTARYVALAGRALVEQENWVPTHGEPHPGNHLVTGTRRYLVDWESLKLAPRERDLDGLVASEVEWQTAYGAVQPDPRMLELFDLEWRLDEISQYATWFSRRHRGTESDAVAFEGLVEELARPDRRQPT
ncbi:phosphotransferase family protein [Nocardioides mesophilus]|uniref:Aminoglycoside phosphotransferase n=1 Tax=Nocardioides mesophilus TaxID=433659 RepID=A0A7G9RCD6_9ACTN|nr:phosphotransferase [Nocardioides mesophilus]QNN53261.1 aminoglycoside phosphotransferase [Nocardioides mesophilus]